MSKTVILSKEDLMYVSKGDWNEDFDGSMLQMKVDENLPRFVRIAVKDREVYFFNKKAFLDHLSNQDLTYVIRAEKEWQKDRNNSDEYEAFYDSCYPLIESFADMHDKTLYISAFDFIREIAVPTLGDISWE